MSWIDVARRAHARRGCYDSSPLKTLAPGRRLGPYELKSRLGAGGMGEVWHALDSRLGRSVAVKVIAESLAKDAQMKARMLSEARAVSALNHPNVCALFDIGIDEGVDFLVMEHIEGETLAKRLALGALPIRDLVDIATQVAEAVREAHAQGITHRDLKPANIMITAGGRVKVLDFGLAKQVRVPGDDEDTVAQSAAGSTSGTLAYMSPEQASGSGVDERSDLFSLGVIMYEMATGIRPFEGTPAQIGAQLLGSEPRPPRSVNPDVPPQLESVITRCMTKQPADRYPSAAELLEALRHVQGPQVNAARASRKRPARRPTVGSVAVLPFANATGDDELDYLSDGIAEGVLHQLSQTSRLRVLARATTFRYRKAADPVAVGRELKVRTVLTGEVSLRRGEVTVSVELVDVRRGTHLWGNVYTDVELRIVQGQIAIGAAEALDPSAEKRASRAVVDEEAYRLYLRGRYALSKGTPSSLRSAVESFQGAIDRDPTLALGFAGLADAFVMFESFAETAAPGSLSKARAAALRAIQLEDSLAEAHTSLAMANFCEWKWEDAERGFHHAIALSPNYDVAHNGYSMLLVTMGRMDEALEAAQRASELNPLSAPLAAHLAAFKVMVGRKAEGLRELRHLVDAEPDVPMIRQWLAYAYDQNGQMENAIDEARREAEISRNGNLALAVLAYHLCRAGQQDEVRGILDTVERRHANGKALPIWIAGIYAGLDERDKALTWLEKAVLEERSSTTTYITWPPWFDNLRSEPRFLGLLHHMGLAGSA